MNQATPAISGVHDFDFFVGHWRVHHRRLKERLASNHEWVEFNGTTMTQTFMGGFGNIDDNVLEFPAGTYRAVTLRSFDAKSNQWSIWWLDSRSPQGPWIRQSEAASMTAWERSTLTICSTANRSGCDSYGPRLPRNPATGSKPSQATKALRGKRTRRWISFESDDRPFGKLQARNPTIGTPLRLRLRFQGLRCLRTESHHANIL